MRGENATSLQLRDDLMTMLIAGHETTAAVLTWALFELAQQPALVRRVQEELDKVLGDRNPTFEDIPRLPLIRLIIAESLRMYPEPPLLIRRALTDHIFPEGYAGFKANITRGTDIFLAVYNIHRSPDFWEEPDKFNPDRFLKPYKGKHVGDNNASLWGGFEPVTSALYPNEVHADYAFLPFGAGPRKCVGDQFAVMEATITLAVLLRRFEFELATPPGEVGMYTGATIHTRNGLKMHVRERTVANELQ
jgi:cytochrome P450